MTQLSDRFQNYSFPLINDVAATVVGGVVQAILPPSQQDRLLLGTFPKPNAFSSGDYFDTTVTPFGYNFNGLQVFLGDKNAGMVIYREDAMNLQGQNYISISPPFIPRNTQVTAIYTNIKPAAVSKASTIFLVVRNS